MKWVVESSPAAVTQRSGKTATLRLSGDCHPTERSWMEEVATRLPTDRPLPDDDLFVDQLEMIYSMDLRSFYRESRVANTCPYRSKLKPLEPLLAASPRLHFQLACGLGWPAGPPIL
ncbi:unnamed protein product [Spirodela intermedia]|uniref:Uncharacterized protein n=1 Tax=Spirodela intermedia TaxID=51605 RepID=A0A7I8K0L5_SPIIN|nr:unnamed protein product [Spirodela intermedia]